MTAPAWVDEFLTPIGPCGLCGHPDARHRVLDSIAAMVRGGDPAEQVAEDFGVPTEFVLLVADQWWSSKEDDLV